MLPVGSTKQSLSLTNELVKFLPASVNTDDPLVVFETIQSQMPLDHPNRAGVDSVVVLLQKEGTGRKKLKCEWSVRIRHAALAKLPFDYKIAAIRREFQRLDAIVTQVVDNDPSGDGSVLVWFSTCGRMHPELASRFVQDENGDKYDDQGNSRPSLMQFSFSSSTPSSASSSSDDSPVQSELTPVGFSEVTPTADDYKTNPFLREAVKAICKRYGRSAPKLVPCNKGMVGPPNRCLYNVDEFVTRTRGAKPLRCFKLYVVPTQFLPMEGCRAVQHVVVQLADGSLVDPSFEPDEERVMVLAGDWCSDYSSQDLVSNAVSLGAFCKGSSQYVNVQQEVCGITDSIHDTSVVAGVCHRRSPPVRTAKEYRTMYKLTKRVANQWFNAIILGRACLIDM